jgi:peptidoglycan/LPS O-acetylase OafA/YrhL
LSDGRNLALDGVRGLAALSVALGHCMLIVAGMDVWSKTAFDFPAMPAQEIAGRLMHLLFPGNGAVMVFFVLSGYVLWGSFARKRPTTADVPDYIVARLFRLLPLVVATTLLYWLVTSPSPGELIANMLLLSTGMNKVLWSLQVEMIGSMVIFIAWLAARNDPIKLFIALCVVAAAVPFFRGNQFVVYLPAFLLGALIHHVPARIWQSRALLVAALLVLLLPSIVFSYRGVTRLLEILAAVAIVGLRRRAASASAGKRADQVPRRGQLPVLSDPPARHGRCTQFHRSAARHEFPVSVRCLCVSFAAHQPAGCLAAACDGRDAGAAMAPALGSETGPLIRPEELRGRERGVG